jgi:hypothetical protein
MVSIVEEVGWTIDEANLDELKRKGASVLILFSIVSICIDQCFLFLVFHSLRWFVPVYSVPSTRDFELK